MKKIKLFFKGAALLLLILISILIYRTIAYPSVQVKVDPVQPAIISTSSVQHLAGAVRFRTVSYDEPGRTDSTVFRNFLDFLKKTYPLSDSLLHRQIINGLSIVYTWQGGDPSLKPLLLIGHMDVVPAEDESKWTSPPFSGEVKDGFVWGRGTMDDKVNVIGILEAVEMMLKTGFKPKRTIYLAFGHDEEVGGNNGATKIAEWMQSKHIEAEFLLDEGLVVTQGIVPGITRNVGLIGIAEKGYVSCELTVEANGGHSSIPEKETPIGILASAVSTMEKNPMPSHFCEPSNQFLDYVGPEMPFLQKLVFANRWLLGKVIIHQYEKTNTGNSMVRTTTAPTVFRSGVKDNVMPTVATAIINFRILPGETSGDVVNYINRLLKDERVKVRIVGHHNDPGEVSDSRSIGFLNIEKAIRQVFPGTITAPGLVVAATDARHYSAITKNLFRFVPLLATKTDPGRIHGVNERIGVSNFYDCIRFYRQLILNSN